MMAADVIISTNRPWTPDVRRQIEERLAPAPVQARTEAVETATMVRAERAKRGQDGGVARRPAGISRSTARSSWKADSAYSHDLLRDRGAIARPELLAQLGIKQGDAILIGGQPFTIRAVLSKEPGRRAGAFTLGSRVFVDYDDLQRSGLLAFGSRASYQILLRVEPSGVEPLTAHAAPRVRRPVRQRVVVPIDRRQHQRRHGAGGELPEPRRLRHRRARRDRRVERHARVRQAEDPQHRDPQVRRSDDPAGARHLRAQVLHARADRQRARRRARRSRAARDSGVDDRGVRRAGAGAHRVGGAAGACRRSSGVAAVLAGAAARSAASQAAAAAARW